MKRGSTSPAPRKRSPVSEILLKVAALLPIPGKEMLRQTA